ncbi:cell division protein FtsL [candidate division FCPU426 bacterium]|nr:cell division protein FtsL [candidate division FCPU426 bacterium]
MGGRMLTGELDREFVTIYFLQDVRENRRLAVRRLWLILGVILFLFSLVSVRVWQQMQVVKLGYQINQQRQLYHRLLDEQRVLLSRRNALASLERLEAIAREELGLEAPSSDQLVFLVDPAAGKEGITGWFAGAGSFVQWLKNIKGQD